uniref:Uncharacterized protein n=1 Tax=Anguilla anguilla TaxID=7936 RepID=A0A0E9SX18_ANGAN
MVGLRSVFSRFSAELCPLV